MAAYVIASAKLHWVFAEPDLTLDYGEHTLKVIAWVLFVIPRRFPL